eukprot:1958139-Prymnesium_polylepis.1
MARHRLRRVCYVGAGLRGVQARGRPADEWEARSPSDFWAHSVRRLARGVRWPLGAPRSAASGVSVRRGRCSAGGLTDVFGL